MSQDTSRRLAREFREKIATGQWVEGGRTPTTRALAAQYGVSVNTVQNAFRELEATDLIERRPRLGGYVKTKSPAPGRAAASRATTIAVVGPYGDVSYSVESAGTWGYRIVRGCERELAEADFHVTMFSFDWNDPDALTKLLVKLDKHAETLAGVFCFINPVIRALPKELNARNIPWVTVNRPREHAPQNFVSQDALLGGRLLGRCLARVGCERIAFLGDQITVGRSTMELYFGLTEGWLEKGGSSAALDYLPFRGHAETDGYERTRDYLAAGGKPSVIVGAGDLLAIGATRALRDAGIDVGKQVRVVGTTGLQLAEYAHPPITVSAVPMEQMGREAARMLLEMAREGVRRLIGRYIPPTLISRESCPIPDEVIADELKQIAQES